MLQTALASIDPVAFDAAADAIARAPRLLISGTGASHAAAQASAVAFAVNGRPCEAPADGVVAHLTARVLAPGDVCLIVSSSGANSVTLAVADAAVDAGATVIGVTSFARTPLTTRADHLLVAGARFQAWDQGILGSGLVQLLVLNALQIAVADRMSDAADRARLAVREEVLDIVADDGSDAEASDVPDVIDHGDGRLHSVCRKFTFLDCNSSVSGFRGKAPVRQVACRRRLMGTIQLSGVGRSFKSTAAVSDIDLIIEDGGFVVLLGPSGCGKTTLLRMIAGLLEPTAGRIHLDGDDITDLPSKKRDLAMVFQSYALYPHLSVRKNLAFPLKTQRLGAAEIATRVQEVADSLEIGHLLDRKPKELSGGQRQRVAVGRALVRNPKAFLMDEPLSNLDAKLRTQTRHELTALHRRLGATFVYVTHDQVEAMTMATKIVVLNAGRIEQYGTPEQVYDRPESVFVAGFLGSPAMNLVDARIVTIDGSIAVTADGIAGGLWPGDVPDLDVVLGVRPEKLTIASAHAASDTRGVRIAGRIDLVENLGGEQIVTCLVAGREVYVRTSREVIATPGDDIVLTAAPENVHLFDRASGRRLEWVADAPVADPAAHELVTA
ncbi:ATP-binding cassette domain-containing protein [Dietzia cinnamea]|nr:ATP-binding cassette domain-containing protein [Dietzia cinnamea]